MKRLTPVLGAVGEQLRKEWMLSDTALGTLVLKPQASAERRAPNPLPGS